MLWLVPPSRQGTSKRKCTQQGQKQSYLEWMGFLLSHALGIRVTLKSLNEVKLTMLLYFQLDWLARSDADLKGTKKGACMLAWQTNQFPCWSGWEQQWGRLPSLSLGLFVQQEHCWGEETYVLHAAEWHHEQETEESVSMRLMKGIADNPRDERLVSEIGANWEISSELWSKADQNLDAASWADKCKFNLLSQKKKSNFKRSKMRRGGSNRMETWWQESDVVQVLSQQQCVISKANPDRTVFLVAQGSCTPPRHDTMTRWEDRPVAITCKTWQLRLCGPFIYLYVPRVLQHRWELTQSHSVRT